MYFVLTYETVEDYVNRRQPFRREHLALAERARREGRLLMAGAFDPPDGALLVFRAESPDEVESSSGRTPTSRMGWCGPGECARGRS